MPDPSELPKELFGFEVLSLLGEGAASHVYAVSERKGGQVFALKHVVRTDEKSQRFLDQVSNELEVGRKGGPACQPAPDP